MPLSWLESGRFGVEAASWTRIARFGAGMDAGINVLIEAGMTTLTDGAMTAASGAARGWAAAGGAMAAGLSAMAAAGFATWGESGGTVMLIG